MRLGVVESLTLDRIGCRLMVKVIWHPRVVTYIFEAFKDRKALLQRYDDLVEADVRCYP